MAEPNKDNLTIIYYTCNYLEKTNPYFLENTEKQLLKAIDDLPLVVVAHKPSAFGWFFDNRHNGATTNIVVGDIGRSHLNIYRQILIGAKAATTKYVAMAEDDILYSHEHFHSKVPDKEVFLYDMNKLSLFTWTKPPMYSFRHNRMVVNQLIAPREMLIDALEERFKKLDELLAKGKSEADVIKYWGDPGRYEELLGVSHRNTDTFMCTNPSIVFTHEFAYGYEFNHGNKKRLGDLRILEIPQWGRAEEVLKLFKKQ